MPAHDTATPPALLHAVLDIAPRSPYTAGMRLLFVLTLALLAARDVRAGVDVRVIGDRVDVVATNAPLAEVLEGLSRQTHIKLVYEGSPPRQLVSVDLKDRTPAEAVLAVLEGQGLAYAVALDRTGTHVQTLLMSAANPAPAGPAAPAPRVVPSLPERPMRESVVEDPLEDSPSEPDPELPPDTGRPNMLPPPALKGEQPPPSAGVFPPGVADYPTSAFAPKPPAPTDTQKKPKSDATPPPFNP
jgi:hypothetical protein